MERYYYLPYRVVSSREWQPIPIFLSGKFRGQTRWASVHGMYQLQRAWHDWTCKSLGLLGKLEYNNLCEMLDMSSLAWWIFIECLLYARCSCISRSSGQNGRPHLGGFLPTFTVPHPTGLGSSGQNREWAINHIALMYTVMKQQALGSAMNKTVKVKGTQL